MKIKIIAQLQPHSMLIKIGGGPVPILFEKRFSVDVDPGVIGSLLSGQVAISAQTFCKGQFAGIKSYDKARNILRVSSCMQIATEAYFEKLEKSGWVPNKAVQRPEGYRWSKERQAEYDKEQRDRAAQDRSLKHMLKGISFSKKSRAACAASKP